MKTIRIEAVSIPASGSFTRHWKVKVFGKWRVQGGTKSSLAGLVKQNMGLKDRDVDVVIDYI